MAETHRDFIVNRRFRRDLFAAQPPASLPAELPIERLEALAFCLTNLPERLALKNGERRARFDLHSQADAVTAVHRLLAAGPASADAIHRATGMTSTAQTAFLIQQLGGYAAYCTVTAGARERRLDPAQYRHHRRRHQ
jgi:hypothetical protein